MLQKACEIGWSLIFVLLEPRASLIDQERALESEDQTVADGKSVSTCFPPPPPISLSMALVKADKWQVGKSNPFFCGWIPGKELHSHTTFLPSWLGELVVGWLL